MSKGQASTPQTVNPTDLAAAQTASNVSTAQTQAALNNASTFSPYGSSVWTPSTNAQGQTTYTLNQNLSPDMAALFGNQVPLATQLAGNAANIGGASYGLGSQGQQLLGQAAALGAGIPGSLNLSGVAPITQLTPGAFQTNVAQGPIQTGVNSNFPQLVQQAQNAAYQQQTQYLDPQWQQSESNLRQQLADQGIQEGTQAFSRAMLDFNNQKQQAYGNAQYQAVQAGNAQQQALFGESLGAGQFANAAQAQGFGQGLNLADLYNQAVLGAANQQNQAVGLGLNEAQLGANYPLQALSALSGAGANIFGQALGSLGAAAPMVNTAPTWPLSIPTYGGQATTVQPTSMALTQSAATQANQLANQINQSNLAGEGMLGMLGSQALFGQNPMSTLFGSGGLLGGMLGGGGTAGALAGAANAGTGAAFSGMAPAMSGVFSSPVGLLGAGVVPGAAGAGGAAAGGGGLLSGIGSWLSSVLPKAAAA